MEFKIRLCHKKKAAGVTAKKDNGYIRVKVRGRKRWVKPAKPIAKKA